MPRFNDVEQATTGTGITWYDNARTLQQVCTNVCTLKLSDGTPISDRGDRIHMEARNRLWVSQDAVGVYGSFSNIPGAAISSGPSKAAARYIGPDGSLIYKKSYQSEGPWFNTATGKDIPGDGDSWQNCGGGKWIARRGTVYDGGHMDIVDQDDKILGRGVWPFWEDGHLLYQASTGELVYDGRTVFPASFNYYRPCFRRRADGSARFAWSPDESEQIVVEHVLTAEEMAACPLYGTPLPIPTFHFTHSLLVVVFKDPEGQSGAPAEIVINQGAQSVARPYIVAEDSLGGPFLGERLGVYTERTDLTALFAKFPYTRLVVGHDDTSDWVLPALRPFDVPMQELYFPRARGVETVAQSAARWQRQSASLLRQWPGDCALDPQFYLMGSAAPWLYTEAEVLEGLSYLSDIANRSERFKLILPFAFLRANGIVAHPTLRTAFNALLRAAGTAGRPVLVPVPKPPIEPPPVDPPKPHNELERVHMAGKIVGLVGPGGFYTRIDPASKTVIHFDATSVGGHEQFEAVKIEGDTRYLLRAVAADVILSADNTIHGSQQVAAQFSVRQRPFAPGNYEMWTIKKDPDSGLVLAFVRYTEQGSVAERKFAGGLLSVIEQ